MMVVVVVHVVEVVLLAARQAGRGEEVRRHVVVGAMQRGRQNTATTGTTTIQGLVKMAVASSQAA